MLPIDQYARPLDAAEKHSIGHTDREYSVPEISDIPIETINKLMYQSRPLHHQHHLHHAHTR
jgi:hypothetical protein